MGFFFVLGVGDPEDTGELFRDQMMQSQGASCVWGPPGFFILGVCVYWRSRGHCVFYFLLLGIGVLEATKGLL